MPLPKTPTRITVDFSNVEDSRAPAAHVPEGDYLLEVAGCQLKSKKDDETSKYLSWMWKIVAPSQFKGKTIYSITSLKPEALWNLRGLLVDMLGEERVPKASVNIPLESIVKARKKVGATVADDEPYEGKVKSKIVATFPASDYQELGQATATPVDDSNGQSEETDDADIDELDVDDL